MRSDLIIAGGGIIGLFTAYALTNSDIKITVVDRGQFGQESSWAAGGILAPLLPWQYDAAVTSLTQNAFNRYAQLAKQLLDATDIDIEFWRCGMAIFGKSDTVAAQSWCKNSGLTYKCNEIPDVSINVQCLIQQKPSIFLPNFAQLRSPRLIKAMITYLVQHGVDLLPDTELLQCRIENEKLVGIETSRGSIQTEQLIWATGAWAQQLQCVDRPITPPHIAPIRGQILAFDGSKIGLDCMLYEDGHYLIPRRDGLILAGSTLEDVGFDKSITDSALLELKQKSTALLPALANSEIVHQWSGLRPASSNNVPTIGPHPQIQGLYFNCGHFRYGIAMAPRSAEIISNWILQPDNTSLDHSYRLLEEPAQHL